MDAIPENELAYLSAKIEFLYEKIPMANACLVSELITPSKSARLPAICSITRQKQVEIEFAHPTWNTLTEIPDKLNLEKFKRSAYTKLLIADDVKGCENELLDYIPCDHVGSCSDNGDCTC